MKIDYYTPLLLSLLAVGRIVKELLGKRFVRIRLQTPSWYTVSSLPSQKYLQLYLKKSPSAEEVNFQVS